MPIAGFGSGECGSKRVAVASRRSLLQELLRRDATATFYSQHSGDVVQLFDESLKNRMSRRMGDNAAIEMERHAALDF